MGYKISIIPEFCTGCRLCEIICSLVKIGEVRPSMAKIEVVNVGLGLDIPILKGCDLCGECVPYCNTGAIKIEMDGGGGRV